jgi:hypothetical protein
MRPVGTLKLLFALAAFVLAVAAACAQAGGELVRVDNATTQMLALSLANSSRDLAALQKLGDAAEFNVSPEPAVDAARASFKRATSVTAALEPSVRERLAGLVSRHDKLLAYFEKDYTDGRRNALGNTLRLIQQTHSELDGLSNGVLATRQFGVAVKESLPADWSTAGLVSREYRLVLAGKSTREVVGEVSRILRQLEMKDLAQDRRIAYCSQLAEAARELTGRADSLSDSSRRGFRDKALRLDVVAENIARMGAPRDESFRKRQERLVADIAGDLEAFLDVNGQ